MKRIIIFGGTTEGRRLAEYLGQADVKVHVCVATEYGESLIEKSASIDVSAERLTEEQMVELIRKNGSGMVIDATHPYAVIVSENIRKACDSAKAEYIRLLRNKSKVSDNVVTVANTDEAVEYLKGTDGNVLVATGSKELSKYTSISEYKNRLYARVLSLPGVAEQCSKLGFEGRNLICMQGPFCEELNYGMMKQFDIRYMVTKDSGDAGGFADKFRAAERAGVKIILVGRPEETGESFDNVVKMLSSKFKIKDNREQARTERRKLSIIGTGMNGKKGMTVEATDVCTNADLLIGAKRMIEQIGSAKDSLISFDPRTITEYLNEHPEYRNIALLFSGDVGFYSGCKKVLDLIENEFDVNIYCGISSPQYLCSKLRVPWEDVFLISAHGLEPNIIGEIRRHEKVFTLLNTGKDVSGICNKLKEYGMFDIVVNVGERMGQEDERIVSGTPCEISKTEFNNLCVALFVNPSPRTERTISDDEFVRGDVPMTKSEIRTLTVSKMNISYDSVIYDIGAGTGSVTMEMSLNAVQGKIFAVEKEKDALKLISENKKRFAADNVVIVDGFAPDALRHLPKPTHAFIGGSSGNLKDIIRMLIEKNPDITVAVNSITLETLSRTLECIKEFGLKEKETVCVSVARSKSVGGMHMMNALNPVYITVFGGSA